MTHSKPLDKEIKLRKLFTDMAKKNGSGEAVFYSDLFHFFDIKKTFDLDTVKNLWGDHLAQTRHLEQDRCLHVDIPFCRQRCEYCGISKWIDRHKAELEHYLKFVTREMRSFRDVFEGVPFQVLHFGGGSSDILTESDLRTLFTDIHYNFTFTENALKTFECNPSDFSYQKVAALADFGINRVSFGVQSLDTQVLQHANRAYQNDEKIKQSIEDSRKLLNLESVSTDLMIGLWNDTPQTVLESFIKLADLNVDSILIYPLVPTLYYLKTYFQNDKELFDRTLAEKLRNFEALIVPVAEQYGYGFVPLEHSTPEAASWDFVLKRHLQ